MQINQGDHVVYVPKQNVGENIHHTATVLSRTPKGMYRLALDTGKKITCSMRRLIVGQIDAFEEAAK